MTLRISRFPFTRLPGPTLARLRRANGYRMLGMFDEACLELYEATLTLCRFSTFSELKRSNRPMLDLPLLTGRAD